MKKNPSIKDYGGDCYTTNYRERYKIADGLSYNCIECGRRRFVLPVELRRAARPKCMHCGGLLEESPSARVRRGLPEKKAAPGAISGPAAWRIPDTVEQMVAKDKALELLTRDDLPHDLARRLFVKYLSECSEKSREQVAESARLSGRDWAE